MGASQRPSTSCSKYSTNGSSAPAALGAPVSASTPRPAALDAGFAPPLLRLVAACSDKAVRRCAAAGLADLARWLSGSERGGWFGGGEAAGGEAAGADAGGEADGGGGGEAGGGGDGGARTEPTDVASVALGLLGDADPELRRHAASRCEPR